MSFLDEIQIVEKEKQEEKKVEESIKTWLAKNLPKGSYVMYKNWGGGIFGRGGRPDIEIAYKGRVDYWELKDPKGDTSPLQKEVIKKYKKAGIEIYVADSLDLFRKQWDNIHSE